MIALRSLDPTRPLRAALARLRGQPRLPACPICGCGRPVVFESARPQSLLLCRRCRHGYWDRRPSAEELAHFYRAEYTGTHHQVEIQSGLRDYYRGHHLRLMIEMVGRPAGELCIVDYGSSIPWLAHEARELGCARPLSVEVSAEAAAFARERGLTLFTPDEFTAKVAPGTVDVMRFSHVLEHLPDPLAVLAEAVGKLRPGGLLYVTQPGFPVFRPQRAGYRLKDSVYPSHLHFFSPLSLKRALRNLPVEVVQFSTHPAAAEVYREVEPFLDLATARRELAGWAALGRAGDGEKSNFPYYCGENGELYARKT